MKAYYSSQLTYQEEQVHIEIEIINITNIMAYILDPNTSSPKQ